MIDTKRLEELRPSFQLLSEAIDFPEQALTNDFMTEFEQTFPNEEAKTELIQIFSAMSDESTQELQEKFTHLFELNKRITLYCTYYRFEDSRERGTVLAKMKMLYEMFGVSLEQAELTDYLPTMLEFLALGQWDERVEDLNLLFSVLEDGTYEVLNQAKEYDDEPYIQLVKAIRMLLKTCVKEEKVSV